MQTQEKVIIRVSPNVMDAGTVGESWGGGGGGMGQRPPSMTGISAISLI